MTLTAMVTQEGELYVAQCAEFDVASQGATFDEAIANLREALELRFEDAPPPSTKMAIIAPIEVNIAQA
jgi:predicted RNase H-like HicB family nuclease